MGVLDMVDYLHYQGQQVYQFTELYCVLLSYTVIIYLAEGLVPAKKVDLDSVPLINGVPLPDLDLESIDKPWQKPGI